jgi:diguanylate cyclase (GGDEF)-like protein
MILDVDGFKKINDTLGHGVGDEVLKRVAAILQSSVREVDSVARYGGDEFVVVMPQTGSEEAMNALNRLLTIFKEKSVLLSGIHFSVSIGVHTSSTEDFNTLFDKSDKDMYARKDAKSVISVQKDILAEIQREEGEEE